MSQLRLSAHQLRIETGRYLQNRTDRAQRLCTLCDKSEVEDEYHFVIICPSYINLRQMYIHPYYFRKPSVFKFTQLMQNKKMSILKKLGKYIYEAFNLRKISLSQLITYVN